MEISPAVFPYSYVSSRAWVENDPSIVGEDLLIIGRQVPIPEVNERIDLLAMDMSGDTVSAREHQLDGFPVIRELSSQKRGIVMKFASRIDQTGTTE